MLQILKFVFKRISIDCITISNIVVRYFLTHCLIIHAIRRKDDNLNYICERVFACQWVNSENILLRFSLSGCTRNSDTKGCYKSR